MGVQHCGTDTIGVHNNLVILTSDTRRIPLKERFFIAVAPLRVSARALQVGYQQ